MGSLILKNLIVYCEIGILSTNQLGIPIFCRVSKVGKTLPFSKRASDFGSNGDPIQRDFTRESERLLKVISHKNVAVSHHHF